MPQFTDKAITCIECGAQWMWTASEQDYYRCNGLQFEPRRCMECREARKRQLTETARRDGRYGAPQPLRDCICADCGGLARVRFDPTPGRPVYCRRCWPMHKPQEAPR